MDLPYIISIRSEFPDAIVMDRERNVTEGTAKKIINQMAKEGWITKVSDTEYSPTEKLYSSLTELSKKDVVFEPKPKAVKALRIKHILSKGLGLTAVDKDNLYGGYKSLMEIRKIAGTPEKPKELQIGEITATIKDTKKLSDYEAQNTRKLFENLGFLEKVTMECLSQICRKGKSAPMGIR